MPRKTNHTVSPRIAPANAQTKVQTKVPTNVSNAPTNVPTYEKPSFGSTILQGFALGTGQSLAFNLFRSDPAKDVAKDAAKDPAKDPAKEINYKEFVHCIKDNPYEDCKQYLNL